MVPLNSCPATGLMIITVGGFISAGAILSTTTDIGFRGASLPARSIRTTLIVCSASSCSREVSQL